MYRTFAKALASGTFSHLLAWRSGLDVAEQEAHARGQLRRGLLEGGVGLLIAVPVVGRVGDAPMDAFGVVGELGTALAHAVAQADHVVHALPGELAQVPGASTAQVGAVLGVRWLGESQAGVECRTGCDQQLAAAGQVEAVVGVPAVGRAAARPHQLALKEPAEVVGDEALGLAEETSQLADLAVAASQLAQ